MIATATIAAVGGSHPAIIACECDVPALIATRAGTEELRAGFQPLLHVAVGAEAAAIARDNGVRR